MTQHPRRLQYLHILDKKLTQNELNVQQRMDLFVVEIVTDTDERVPAIVIDSNGIRHDTTIIPRDWPFLPNSTFDILQSLLITTTKTPNTQNRLTVIYDRMAYGSDTKHMSATYVAGQFIYPVVHTMTKRGIGLRYSSTNNRGHFGVSKVILNFNEKLYPYLDLSGEYGMGQFSFGLQVSSKKHGEDLVKALMSLRFQRVVKATKWGAYQTDRRMFEFFNVDFYMDFL
jgi:hypothetical protein